MAIWEVDCYRRPLQDAGGNPLWELTICDSEGGLRYSAMCPQSGVSSEWVTREMKRVLETECAMPEQVRVFRPQALNLLEAACGTIAVPLIPTRRTPTLKQYLRQLAQEYPAHSGYTGQAYDPVAIDKPPPLPLDENLLGQQWQFAALPAADLADAFTGRMIPILELPEELLPLKLGLASTTPVPGVVIEGGRRSLRLAQWIQESRPFSLNYIAGAPDGLVLEAGLSDRWIIATFDNAEVTTAAQEFEHRKQATQGLHFLLVQPDNAGITYSGFWLLQAEIGDGQ